MLFDAWTDHEMTHVLALRRCQPVKSHPEERLIKLPEREDPRTSAAQKEPPATTRQECTLQLHRPTPDCARLVMFQP